MSTTTFEELYTELMNLIEAGDEAVAREFLTAHLTEFPEEVQNKIAFAFFEESVLNQVEEESAIREFQEEGIETMSQLKKLKKGLEDDQKIQDLRKDLEI